MERTDQIYRDLQRHLDRQPIGFPASKSGADLRLLKRLFSPEEAKIAMMLTYKPTSAERVKELAGLTGGISDDLEDALEVMVMNGSIGRVEREGKHLYFNTPLVVGMYEGQVKNLNSEFLDDFLAYASDRSFGLSMISTEVPQMRTIPVEASLSFEHQATTYDHLVEIINSSEGPYAVFDCICRKAARIKGGTCKKTTRLETCMALGDMAKVAIENDTGREIDKGEALAIARLNQADGLVLQPSNTQKVDFVCACCGCCCGMLNMQKGLPKPLEFWATNYHAVVDAEVCSGCGTCVERCQVGAVRLDDGLGISVMNLDRCVGCGNCVTSCPTGAMRLLKNDEEAVPPKDTEDLFDTIMANKKGTLGKAKVAAKIVFKR